MSAGPPRPADRFARRLLGSAEAERLLADLHDEYATYQRPERGRLRADLWYWRQVLSSVRALRRGGRPTRSGIAPSRPSGLADVGQDARFAGRQLLRAPTFTVAAVVTLALGIGATTSIFSVIHGVLLEALPYDSPDRILRAWAHTDDGSITDFTFRVVEVEEVATRTEVFEAVGAEFPLSGTVLIPGEEPQQVQGRRITAGFFDVFGVSPALGRMFNPTEVAAADRSLVVVTHAFWSRFLGQDPAAVGRPIDVDGTAFEVVGVLPPDYRHVSGDDAQLFIPYSLGTSGWIAHWLQLYTRTRPEVSAERAEAELNDVLLTLGETDRRSAGWNATVEPLRQMVVGDVRPALLAMFAMVALVLLIACVNVANLTLARSTTRVGELSVRRALGAGRGRIARQLFVESAVVAAVGGVVGVAVAAISLEALIRWAPPEIPRLDAVGLDPVVLGFSVGITVLTAVAFGWAPVISALRTDPAAGLADRGRLRSGGRGPGRVLGGLVVAQVALALTLLFSAGLMVRTLDAMSREDMGFRQGGALTFRVAVPSTRYPTGADTWSFYEQLREQLGSLPGVTAVGAGSDLPLSGQGAVATVTGPDLIEAGAEEGVTVLQRRATAGLFEAMGTPVVAGREFDGTDRADGPPVAILSASLAERLFPDGDAVGRRVGWGRAPDEDDWLTVVGVVEDVRYEQPHIAPDPQVYQAHAQSATRDMAVVVRTSGDPTALIGPVRGAVAELDAQVPVYAVATLDGLVGVALAGRRFTMALFSAFAVVALALTIAGLYGVLAFAVGRRTGEIGLRMALGAGRSDVAGMVLAQGLGLVGAGLLLGVVGALAAARLLEGLVFGVPSTDPMTFGVVALGLTAVAAAACLLPAVRASRADPVRALRDE